MRENSPLSRLSPAASPSEAGRTPGRAGALRGVVPPHEKRKTPREFPPKHQPSRGSQFRPLSGRGPNSVRSQQKQVLLLRDSCESLASVSRPDHRLNSRSVGGRPLGPPWRTSRSAVVFVRSTIPKDPRPVLRPTFRLQFPADFRLTFLPASRLSGPTGLAVTRRVGRRRRVSPSTWREK